MKKMIFLKVKNSYNKKLVTWLDLNLQVAQLNKFLASFFGSFDWKVDVILILSVIAINIYIFNS